MLYIGSASGVSEKKWQSVGFEPKPLPTLDDNQGFMVRLS